jgi:hypothetical protein
VPEQAAAEAGDNQERIPPLTGLVLGLVALMGVLFCTQPTVVFFLLGCGLVLLHRDLVVPARPLEEYARFLPAQLESLFRRLCNPDGKVVLAILLLAVAVFLAPQIVFGLAGAVALSTGLYLLNCLDRPAEDLMRWLSARERAWAGWAGSRLDPGRALALGVLSCGPPLFCLAGVFLPRRFTPALSYRIEIAGGLVCLLLVLAFLGRTGSAKPDLGRHDRSGRRTLFFATMALSLALCCVGIQIARRMKIPFLTEALEWNGLWLGLFPSVALWIWWSGHRARWGRTRDDSAAPTGSEAEAGTARYSALGGVMAAGVSALLWRAGEVEKSTWTEAGGVALSVVAVVGWWGLSKLLLGLVRAGPGARLPEWTMVFLAATVCMVFCFFMVQFGGAAGLVAAVYPMVMVWREAARLMRQFQPASESPSTAPV